MSPKRVFDLYAKLSRRFPSARTELRFRNTFELLIAVILSAQSTDKVVNSVTPQLFAQCPSPESLSQLGETRLRTLIRRVGLAPTKARNIIKTCSLLLAEHRGEVPGTREELERLPGVGRKTANVILNEGFGQATIAVDTHVFRIANRTGLAQAKTVLAAEKQLLAITPEPFMHNAHRYLILHGRYVCKAQNPLCGDCVINQECLYPHKSSQLQDKLPHRG